MSYLYVILDYAALTLLVILQHCTLIRQFHHLFLSSPPLHFGHSGELRPEVASASSCHWEAPFVL